MKRNELREGQTVYRQNKNGQWVKGIVTNCRLGDRSSRAVDVIVIGYDPITGERADRPGVWSTRSVVCCVPTTEVKSAESIVFDAIEAEDTSEPLPILDKTMLIDPIAPDVFLTH